MLSYCLNIIFKIFIKYSVILKLIINKRNLTVGILTKVLIPIFYENGRFKGC